MSLIILLYRKFNFIKTFLNINSRDLFISLFFLFFILTFVYLGVCKYLVMLGLLNYEYKLLKVLVVDVYQIKVIVSKLLLFYPTIPKMELGGWFISSVSVPFKIILIIVCTTILAYDSSPSIFNCEKIFFTNKKVFFFDKDNKILESIQDLDYLTKQCLNDKHVLTLEEVRLIIKSLENNRSVLLESLAPSNVRNFDLHLSKMLKINETLCSILKRVEYIFIKLHSNDSLLLPFKEVNDAMFDWGVLYY